jgi:hypothetical protein
VFAVEFDAVGSMLDDGECLTVFEFNNCVDVLSAKHAFWGFDVAHMRLRKV